MIDPVIVCDQHDAGRMSGHLTAISMSSSPDVGRPDIEIEVDVEAAKSIPDERLDVDNDALLLAVYGVIQGFITDERPEVLSENFPWSLSSRNLLVRFCNDFYKSFVCIIYLMASIGH